MPNDQTAQDAILRVDDNPTNLQVLFQTLEGIGCKLLIAKNGDAALSMTTRHCCWRWWNRIRQRSLLCEDNAKGFEKMNVEHRTSNIEF